MPIRLRKTFDRYTPVGDALAGVLADLRSGLPEETVRVRESFGRVAARRYVATQDIPRHATSHWDGFAVSSLDLRNATVDSPVLLKLRGSGKLGGPSPLSINHGEAARVATGGRLPKGSDTVLPLETVGEESGGLKVTIAPKQGDHVYPAGGDIRRGESVILPGQVIRAQDVGLLVALGLAKVRVRRRPEVSVIATGSELTDSARPQKGKVRNSHSPILLRLCEAQGCQAVDLGIVPDDPREIRRSISLALAESDLVITLGGTSVGRHDDVGDALRSLHPSVMFHGLKMDRGRVTGVAVVRGRPILMAPGPIQGAVNAFILLGIPIIRRLTGAKQPEVLMPCKLGSYWVARERFADSQKIVYVKLRVGTENIAEPLWGETESLKVLVDADGYIWVPEGVTRLAAGSEVTVRMLPGFSGF